MSKVEHAVKFVPKVTYELFLLLFTNTQKSNYHFTVLITFLFESIVGILCTH